MRFSYAQKRIIPASTRAENCEPHRVCQIDNNAVRSARYPMRRFDARPALDYLANVIKYGEVRSMPHDSTQFAQFHRPNALRAAASLVAAIAPTALGVALLLAAAAALALVAWPAHAALYKWTDANGRVIYSDQPPNGPFKVESLNGPPPPANPNAAKELASKEAELKQTRILRADEETKAAKTKADNDKKREQCARVRGQLAMMQNDQNVLFFRSNEKGEPVYMDDAARRREREQLEGFMRENCAS
jgi:hypothetical protein